MAFVTMTDGPVENSNTDVHETEWGVSISERAAQKTPVTKALVAAALAVFALASLFLIPVLVGLVFFGVSKELLMEVGVIAAILGLAKYLQVQSRKGPKNAFQIDYKSSELRLGSVNSVGAFVRHKVYGLRTIFNVRVEEGEPPALVMETEREDATVRFANTSIERLTELADQIETAAEEARAAPIRSRIQSRVNGIGASAREVSKRVRSRVNSTFA